MQSNGPLPQVYSVGDHIMLSTLHRRQEYKKKGEKCVIKFFSRFDGPYDIIDTHPSASTYILDLPNSPNIFPTFHTSELKRYIPNDPLCSQVVNYRIPAQSSPLTVLKNISFKRLSTLADEAVAGNTWFNGPAMVPSMITGYLPPPWRTVKRRTYG